VKMPDPTPHPNQPLIDASAQRCIAANDADLTAGRIDEKTHQSRDDVHASYLSTDPRWWRRR